MTDEQAVFGPYRARECEWSDPEPCGADVVPTKAYCEKHMKMAYRTVKAKQADMEVEAVIKAEIGEELESDAE
jgi:hypothetical protein